MIPYDKELLGQCILVRIINTFRFHIVGRVVCRNPEPLTAPCSPDDYDVLIPKSYEYNEEVSPLEREMNKKVEKEHGGFSDEEEEAEAAQSVQLSKKQQRVVYKHINLCTCGANPGGMCIGKCRMPPENVEEIEEEKSCTCGRNPGGACTCKSVE